MLRYKINVIKALKDVGYNATVILNKRLIGQHAMQALRENRIISPITLNRICALLNMQPGDIIEYVDIPGEFDAPSNNENKNGNTTGNKHEN